MLVGCLRSAAFVQWPAAATPGFTPSAPILEEVINHRGQALVAQLFNHTEDLRLNQPKSLHIVAHHYGCMSNTLKTASFQMFIANKHLGHEFDQRLDAWLNSVSAVARQYSNMKPKAEQLVHNEEHAYSIIIDMWEDIRLNLADEGDPDKLTENLKELCSRTKARLQRSLAAVEALRSEHIAVQASVEEAMQNLLGLITLANNLKRSAEVRHMAAVQQAEELGDIADAAVMFGGALLGIGALAAAGCLAGGPACAVMLSSLAPSTGAGISIAVAVPAVGIATTKLRAAYQAHAVQQAYSELQHFRSSISQMVQAHRDIDTVHEVLQSEVMMYNKLIDQLGDLEDTINAVYMWGQRERRDLALQKMKKLAEQMGALQNLYKQASSKHKTAVA